MSHASYYWCSLKNLLQLCNAYNMKVNSILCTVSCVRWKPRPVGPDPSGLFVTGSWDDQANSVKLWFFSDKNSATEPLLLSKISNNGDVNQIEFLDRDTLVVGSSDGSVRLLLVASDESGNQWRIQKLHEWNLIDLGGKSAFSASCNSVGTMGEKIAGGGEGGTLAILDAKTGEVERIFNKDDNCSLSSTRFIKHDEAIAANMRGQIHLFDLRESTEGPVMTLANSIKEQVGVSCTAKHPTQSHIICSGSQQGSLSFWDLRGDKHLPVTVLTGHELAVNEVKFHPSQPEYVFSCSENGDIWQWNAESSRSMHFSNSFGSKGIDNPMTSEPLWFINEAVKHRLESKPLMSKQMLPINSLDVLGQNVLFGGDNEAVYVHYNLQL